jgi:homocitrate synthase NifV
MIRIIDNTLTGFDGILPSKGELHLFCKLLTIIGVDMIELSIAAYERMEELPEEGNYVLHINFAEEMDLYPGFGRYTCHHEVNQEKMIHEIQINDVREIVRLRTLNNCKELRITGLDDIMCGAYEKTMNEIKKSLPNSKINFCPENTYCCASALAVQWLLNYGSDVTTSFAGYKNNAATEEVIMALRLAVRHKPNRDLTVLPELAELFEKITGTRISNKKPVIGKNIFKVEAGIHADGIRKNPATYEAYEPGCVGGRSEIVIGKHSGMKAVKLKMEELKLVVPEDAIVEKILNLVKEVCTENGNSLEDNEFAGLALEVIANEGK